MSSGRTSGGTSIGHAAPGRPMAAGHSSGMPMRGNQGFGQFHANSFGASSAPPPSFELPRTVTPHWEVPSNIHVQPNPVQGNRIPRNRGIGFGVGYVGLPYYGYPWTFGDDADGEDYAAQQAQPNPPAGPDYGPQGQYAEGPQSPYEDGGYPPQQRAPYNPEPYPQQQQQNSAATQSDGLDHPAVTLVFNDGRPPMQVHSYALTSSSVFVAEESGHQRVIPITDLDLPATIAQNREAGVDFALPGGSKR